MVETADELSVHRKLREVLELLTEQADPARMLPPILDQAIALVGAERGFVCTLDGKEGVSVIAARNIDREAVQQPEFKLSRSLVHRVAESGRGAVITDAQEDASTKDVPSVVSLKLRSVLCVPLRAQGRTLGVVYVDHRFLKGSFKEEHLRTLESFAIPAGLVLDAAAKLEALRRQNDELAARVETVERLRAELGERYREQSREANRLRSEAARALDADVRDELPGLIARSPAMRRVVELARKIAASDVPVLIVGESGTGKEVLARAIHALSARRAAPFVAENCAALADTLLESELFGHEPGAFTGATKEHAGLFEQGAGGTFFLDEVGEMSGALQAKLLRVLQERVIRRVGGERSIPVDVRVVAATHRDLDGMAARGEFRADLLYRLNVVRIDVPPLRERLEDLPALLDHFLAKAPRQISIEPQARELLLSHGWPGNVREMENEVRRLAVLAGPDGVVRPSLLSRAILGAPSAAPAASAASDDEPPIEGVWKLEELEKEMIARALRRARGNKAQAARLLGLAKSSFYDRLKKYGLE